MKCENYYCIYEKDGECLFDEVGVTSGGICSECILVSVPFEALEKLKQIQREQFEQMDKNY